MMETIKMIVEWLKGKKTYFVIAAALATVNLEVLGILPDGTYEKASPTFELLGVGTIAAKLNRMIGK